MGNANSETSGNQTAITGTWRNWSKELVALLPFEVQRCQSFRAGLKKKLPHKGNYRRSCRRDTCPACGRMWANEFITQHAIRFGIPDNPPYSLVINFPPLNISKSSKVSSAVVDSFKKQQALIEHLRKELAAAFCNSTTVAGWFGVAHFVPFEHRYVRHHLHLGFIGSFSGIKSLVLLVKKWAKKHKLEVIMDRTPRAERSLPSLANYMRHEPLEAGFGKGHFHPQTLAQAFDAIEKPWREGGGRRSMFARFIDGPAWSRKGLRGLQSRVVKEVVTNAGAGEVGMAGARKRSERIKMYMPDLQREIFSPVSVVKIKWVVKCPNRYVKAKKKGKKCRSVSIALLPESGMICTCEQCKKTWTLQRVYGRKRNRKTKNSKP